MSSIKLGDLGVLDAVEQVLEQQRDELAKKYAADDAPRAAVLNSVITQLKLNIMEQLRSRCEAPAAAIEPVDTELANKVMEAQNTLKAKASQAAALRAQYQNLLHDKLSARLKTRASVLSAPLDDDDNSAEPVAASSSGSARKRQRTSDNSATSASASLSDRENRTEVDEQISSGLAVLKDTADDIASVLLEEGPKLSRALRDAHDTAVVVRQVAKGPQSIDKVIASTGSNNSSSSSLSAAEPAASTAAKGRPPRR